MARRRTIRRGIALAAALAAGGAAQAEGDRPLPRPTTNLWGVTGAIDTPTADALPDGEITATHGRFAGIGRNTLAFQMLPRVQGAFRYGGFQDLNFRVFEDYYDRSFDITLQLLREGTWTPALKLGLQDFVGTGVNSAEYLVATKNVGPVKVSAGLGWGRLGTEGAIANEGDPRLGTTGTRGGEFNLDRLFTGPVAPFGSVAWAATDRLTLLAEVSSDGYLLETNRSDEPVTAMFERESSVNLGLDYRVNDAVRLGLYHMYGSEVGVRLTFQANPKRPPVEGSIGPAPQPVNPRPPRAEQPALWVETWVGNPNSGAQLLQVLNAQLEADGPMVATRLTIVDAGEVIVRVRNPTFDAPAQAVGRVARALTRTMPSSVETFRIVTEVDGMGVSEVRLRRSDLEAIVAGPDAADRLLAVAAIGEAARGGERGSVPDDLFPRVDFSFGPYLQRVLFDPAQPVQFRAGLRARAEFEPVPGLILLGQVSQPLVSSTRDPRPSDSRLPVVRTDFARYADGDGPTLDRLTAAGYAGLGRSVYGRVTAGYLERAFAGVSAEVLWKPVNSRLGFGAELNYARKRAYDGFGVQDYDVITGHVSAYARLGGGFEAQLDVGRYLAGDEGATLSLSRRFANGWELGAFATKTNVSAEQFGEGSFDKGITVSVPLSWFTGKPTRRDFSTTIRPVTRDGGARLSVAGRLYGTVTEAQRVGLEEQWSRVWR